MSLALNVSLALHSSIYLAVPTDPCILFPCDVYSSSCVASGSSNGDKSDRICGACRFGYQAVGDTCVNVVVNDASNDKIGAGNVETVLQSVAVALDGRLVNQGTVSDVVAVANKIALVCNVAHMQYILIN